MIAAPPSPGRRRTMLLVVWMGALCSTWWLLARSAHGDLASPPLDSWTGFGEWARHRDEAELTIVMIRLVAQSLVLYLLVLTATGSLLRLTPAPNTILVDRFTPAWLVHLLDSSLGLGLAAALGLATVTVPLAPQPSTPTTHEILAGDADPGVSGGATEPMVAVPVDSDPMTMVPVHVPDRQMPATPLVKDTDVGPTTPAPVAVGVRDRIWITEPGDHLWSIAAETLADELGIEPTTEQIGVYWSQLVTLNRDRLIDRANADLIIPGQEFELPPVP